MPLQQDFLHHLVKHIMSVLRQCVCFEDFAEGFGVVLHAEVLQNLIFHALPKLGPEPSCLQQTGGYSRIVFHINIPHGNANIPLYFFHYRLFLMTLRKVLKDL